MTAFPLLASLVLFPNLFPEATLRLTKNAGYDGAPQVYGNAVAWSGYAAGDREIFLRQGSQLLQLTNNGYDDLEPRMHAGQLVWLAAPAGGDREVFFWNGTAVVQLTDNAVEEDRAEIHGGWMVWQGFDGNDWEIFVSQGVGVSTITDNGANDTAPAVDGGQVVWVGWDGHDDEIYFFDGSRTTQLTSNDHADGEPRIHRGRVAWSGWDGNDHEVFVWNEGTVAQLSDNAIEDTAPHLDHGGVAWLASTGGEGRVQFWDGTDVTAISAGLPSPGDDDAPAIEGGLVVWSRFEQGDREIYLWDGVNAIRLTDNEQDDHSPRVHRGKVAWESEAEVYVWNGAGSRLLASHAADAEASYLPEPGASIDAGWVTWSGQVAAGGDPDALEIFVWDGIAVTQLTNDAIADVSPRIHDGQITWQSGLASESEVQLWSAEETVALTSNGELGDLTPELHRGQIAWDGQVAINTDYEIFAWDGTTTQQLSDNAVTDQLPQIHDGWVAWTRLGAEPELDGVFLWDGSRTVQLNGGVSGRAPRIHDHQVVWSGGEGDAREIFLFDGTQTIQLTANTTYDLEPDIHRGQVAWCGMGGHADSEILLWDGANVRQLTDDSAEQSRPSIADGQVAWWSWDVNAPHLELWDGEIVHDLTTTSELSLSSASPRLDDGQVVWTSLTWEPRLAYEIARTYVASARPHEVRGLRSVSATRFRWNPAVWAAPADYGVIRGDLANLSFAGDEVELGAIECLAPDLDDLTVTDGAIPPAQAAWFYLVRATRYGDYGSSSSGRARFAASGSCP